MLKKENRTSSRMRGGENGRTSRKPAPASNAQEGELLPDATLS
jgi:hypothetical protein